MKAITVAIGEERFAARLQDELAPQTCARFRALMPRSESMIHARWSGEACWIPLGTLDLGVGFEGATSRPSPGQLILYPGGISETEILLPYGEVSFACRAGPLAGNPFLLITEKLDRLAEIGRQTLWTGARDISFVPCI